MARFLSTLALAAALLAAAAASAGAGAQPPTAGEVYASAEFDLRGSNGFRAEFETSEDQVALAVRGQRRYVIYQTEGEVTAASVVVQFGKLGRIDFRFEPTKTLATTPPERGCSGAPWTEKEGFFVGEASFHGERGYTTIDVHRVRGRLSTSPEWDCPPQHGPLHPGPIRGRAGAKEKIGVLRAGDGDGRSFLAASGSKGNGSQYAIFSAGLTERSEAMTIGRGAFAVAARASRFVYDHEAGTATARPPAPFSGHASFVRHGNAKRPGSWRGTLRVSLLGHDPVRLAGAGFTATLNRDLPGD